MLPFPVALFSRRSPARWTLCFERERSPKNDAASMHYARACNPRSLLRPGALVFFFSMESSSRQLAHPSQQTSRFLSRTTGKILWQGEQVTSVSMLDHGVRRRFVMVWVFFVFDYSWKLETSPLLRRLGANNSRRTDMQGPLLLRRYFGRPPSAILRWSIPHASSCSCICVLV